MVNLEMFFKNEQVKTVGSNIRCALVENPAALFNSEDGDTVAELIHLVIAQAFGKDPEGKNTGEIRAHIKKIARVAVLYRGDEKNEVIGFSSAGIFDQHHLMYLNRIAVDNRVRENGMGRVLLETLEDHIALPHCALTTQNPVVFNLMRKKYARIFPSPNESMTPSRLHDLGSDLVKNRYKLFDQHTFVITDLYDECMYPCIPDSHDSEVDHWFKKTLHVIDGRTRNGFLFIAEDRYTHIAK